MAKFSLLTTLTLQAAGFDKGINQAKKSAKSLSDGIKTAGDAMGSALSPLTQSIGGLGGEFTGMATGAISAFKKLIPAITSVKTALISTGIGAIIIGISTAIAGLIGWMKRTDEGSDSMRKAFDIVKAVINTVLEKITFLGSAIVKLFKGDFKGAVEDAKNAVTGWGQAMKENIEAGKELNDIQDKIEDYDETVALKRAKLEDQIAEYRLRANDNDNYSAQERLKYAEQLKAKQTELYNLNARGAQLNLDMIKKEVEMGADNQDNRQKINEAEAQLYTSRAEYNRELRKTQELLERTRKETQDENIIVRETAIETAKIGNIMSVQIVPSLSTMKTGLVEMKKQIITSADYWKMYEEGGISAFTLIQAQGQMAFDEISNSVVDLGGLITSGLIDAVLGLTAAFGSLFAGTSKGFKDVVTTALKAIQQIINALLAQAIAGMIAGESKKGLWGLVTAAIGVAALIAFWETKVPKFATGGIVSQPTLAMVGEYPSAKSNPEVIAPLSKLQDLIGNTGGGEVTFRIEGTTLVGVLNNYNRTTNTYR